MPAVSAHPGELSQGLLNLIVNATHAIAEKNGPKSDAKGLIEIATKHDDTSVYLSVTDSGTGIPEKVISRIFDQFFTTKEVGKGTGQGLAICHAIFVEKLGGNMGVVSEVGQGTTFTVTLPRDKSGHIDQDSGALS